MKRLKEGDEETSCATSLNSVAKRGMVIFQIDANYKAKIDSWFLIMERLFVIHDSNIPN